MFNVAVSQRQKNMPRSESRHTRVVDQNRPHAFITHTHALAPSHIPFVTAFDLHRAFAPCVVWWYSYNASGAAFRASARARGSPVFVSACVAARCVTMRPCASSCAKMDIRRAPGAMRTCPHGRAPCAGSIEACIPMRPSTFLPPPLPCACDVRSATKASQRRASSFTARGVANTPLSAR